MTPRGSVNAWKCEECGLLLVAIHVDDGVTPMLLGCRVTAGCTGMMISSGYPRPPIPEHILERLAWEWRKASTTQLKRWRRDNRAMFTHCEMGGLVLAPLSDAGRTVLGELR